MSSYGSLSPDGENSPNYDRYEAPFYPNCGTHQQDSPLSCGDSIYWSQASNRDLQATANESYPLHHEGYRIYGYEEISHQHQSNLSSIHPSPSHQSHDPYIYDPYSQMVQNPYHHIQHPDDGTGIVGSSTGPPFVRVVKKRNTANKKERRRTQSINTAFSDLRDCIPNVPADTKLSKIKTLRLATSYISYLMGVLETDLEPVGGFRAEVSQHQRRQAKSHHQNTPYSDCRKENNNLEGIGDKNARLFDKIESSCMEGSTTNISETRRGKGRTGWPQHVWALELKQEQNL